MNDPTLSLSSKFNLELVRRFLEENPELALEFALKAYEDCLVLSKNLRELQKEVLVSHLNLYL